MALTSGNKKIVDMKRWDFCTPLPFTTGAGMCSDITYCKDQLVLFITAATTAYLYEANEDSYIQIGSPGISALAAGACIAGIPWSTGSTIGAAGLNPTAGTSTTITTNQTIVVNLAGYQIQLLDGPGAGDIKTIASNTIGANSVITVTSAFSATPTTGTLYRLLTPRWIAMGTGAISSTTIRIYDYATNTWTGGSQTNLPATIGTDGAMISSSQYANLSFNPTVTGASTGSNTSTTLNNTGKNWATNQFANMQVRIVSGTGAGQIRTIASNTATALTVATWTTTPDATSVYAIEGNDDHIYYHGSATAQMYRYSLSTNSWSGVGSSRSTTPSTGVSLSYFAKTGDSVWGTENTIIDGRRIYSFRGGATTTLDYYDIAAGAWTNVANYSPGVETFTTGTEYANDSDGVFIQKDATGRWFKFYPANNLMEPWGVTTYTQGAAALGNRSFVVKYVEGATTLKYVYFPLNTSNVILRQLVI